MKELKTDKLFNSVRSFIEESRNSIARQVNTAMVFTYYHEFADLWSQKSSPEKV